MRYLKENTATRITVGPFLDVTDGVTPEVALTVTNDWITFMVDDAGVPTLVIDAAPTASAGNNDMVHVTSDIAGFYDLELTAAQTNYTGRAMLMIHDTDVHLPVFHEFQIVSANVYDSLFTDGDVLDVNVTQWLGTAAATPTTAGVPEVDVTFISGTAQTAGDVTADTAAILLDTDVIDDATSGLVKIASDVAEILVDTSTTLDTKLNDIQGATFATGTDSLEALRNRGDAAWTGGAVTSTTGTATAGGADTITLENNASALADTYNGQLIYISSGTGAGQSRAIEDYAVSTYVATVITPWSVVPDATSVYSVYPNEITEITAAPTAAAVADAVWDEATSGHTSGGTFGEQCKVDIDAILVDTAELQTDWVDGGRLDLIQDIIAADTTTDIPALIATAQSDLDTLTGSDGATLATTQGNYAPAKAGDNMGTVSSVTGNVDGTVASVVGAVGSVTGHTAQTGDTFALANGATGFAAIDTVVDAVKVQTDKLAFTVANQVDANVESINATTVLGVGTSGDKWRA